MKRVLALLVAAVFAASSGIVLAADAKSGDKKASKKEVKKDTTKKKPKKEAKK